jgi:RecA-family ATPase
MLFLALPICEVEKGEAMNEEAKLTQAGDAHTSESAGAVANEFVALASQNPDPMEAEPDTDWEAEMYEALEQDRIEALTKNTITASDLWSLPKREIQSYIPNLAIAGGLTILCGDPKAGKTTFMLWALGALAQSKSFLDEETHAEKVLYATEQSSHIFKEQLTKIPAHKGNKTLNIIPLENNGVLTYSVDTDGVESVIRTPFISWSKQLEFWKTNLEKTKAKLLVVDTLLSFAHLQGGDSFDAGVMGQLLAQLKQSVFSVNRDIAIIVLHHLRKGRGKGVKDFNSMAGSYALRASSDCNILLLKGEKNRRVIKTESRMGEVSERTIALDDEGYRVLNEMQFNAAARIEKALHENPEYKALSQEKLADVLKVGRQTIRTFLKNNPQYAG